ncbi:hypothetical protein [Pirellulimonas nuda]|uniref:hypothetical protein n=1 Tax=Pirellulimonas nuda TaxID=2528009 RepID=UPI0018D2F898|nr:hypothetical protein [Pirellulimonas nuda]
MFWLSAILLLAGQCPAQEASDEAASEESRWLFRSPFADVKWPEIKWKQPAVAGEEGQAPSESVLLAPFRKLSSATQSAMSGVQSSWNRTVDRFKITGEPSPTAQAKSPGFFQRMFASEPEPRGAETMQEFVAQERPKLSR